MTRTKSAKTLAGRIILGTSVHINRPHLYENKFFKNGLPVLQGITFPLRSKLFASGEVRLREDSKVLGVTGRNIDVRNISYAIPVTREGL